MGGVVALGECMVELALNGAATALVSYAGDTFNTAVYLRRLGREAAYGTALGVEGVILVYPGKRWRCQEYRFTHALLRLTMCSLRVSGPREACARSARRLARVLKTKLPRKP